MVNLFVWAAKTVSFFHSFTGWAMPVLTQLSSGGTAEAMILRNPSCPRRLLQGRVRRLGETLEVYI